MKTRRTQAWEDQGNSWDRRNKQCEDSVRTERGSVRGVTEIRAKSRRGRVTQCFAGLHRIQLHQGAGDETDTGKSEAKGYGSLQERKDKQSSNFIMIYS